MKAGPGRGQLRGDADADAWVVILLADHRCRGADGVEYDAVVQVFGGDFVDRGPQVGVDMCEPSYVAGIWVLGYYATSFQAKGSVWWWLLRLSRWMRQLMT